MNAWIWQAALYCDGCISAAIAGSLSAVPECERDDSDRYPQGPYCDGGGEADSPQHCDECGLFLENPLTDDGRRYVAEAVAEGKKVAREQWARFYGVGEG